MSCRTEARLGPYLEGELPPGERRAVESHLARCGACSQALRELRATVELLRLIPEPPLPAELERKVMDRIAADEPGLARLASRLLRAMGPQLPSAVGALAATALAVLVVRTIHPSGSWWTVNPAVLRSAPEQARIDEPAWPASDPVEVRREVRLEEGPLRPPASGARGLPVPFRLTERGGGVGAGPAAPGALAILPPRPLLARCEGFGRGVDQGRSPAFDCHLWLNSMLSLGLFDPQRFLREVRALPEEESEAWLRDLVGFAARSGRAAQVAAGLRTSAEPAAVTLAERFERGSRTASTP